MAFLHGAEINGLSQQPASSFLPEVDLFLSNSEATWKRFVAECPPCARLVHRVVPLGIGEAAQDETRNDREPAAVIIGRMEQGEDYKGHRELIEIWPDVRRRIAKAELWVVGDGSLRTEFQSMAASRCPEGIRFLGYVTEDEKETLLQRARCLAMPSRGEGFGLAYAEAMRLGTPCLVGTLDGGIEVVSPPIAGLSADPRSPGDLANAICTLLNDGEQWKRMSLGARQRYGACFTARHFQARLLEALR